MCVRKSCSAHEPLPHARDERMIAVVSTQRFGLHAESARRRSSSLYSLGPETDQAGKARSHRFLTPLAPRPMLVIGAGRR